MIRSMIPALVPLCLVSAPALADDGKLEVEGSIRARVEVIDGQFRPNTADSGALMLRTQLRAEYDAGPVRIGGEIQDARVYFERLPTSIGATEVNALEPTQAYLIAEISKNAELQLGRMTMDWGSRRFVSRQNYRNSTNAFTGARFDWKPAKGDSVTLFWVMPQDRLPNDKDGILDNEVELDRERIDQQFFGGRVTKANVVGSVALETYLYRLFERDAENFATRNRRLWTTGFRLLDAPKKGQVDFEIEAAWQGGSTRASASASDRTDLDVNAGFVHASLGYTFDAPWSPRVRIAYDYASGDRPGGSYSRFDTLFGARVFEFGPSSLYGPIGRANLSAPEVRVEAKPDKRWDGYVAVRPLWLDSATDTFSSTGLRDATGGSGRYAGTQFDTRVRYWLKPDQVRLAAGVAVLAKGRFMKEAPRAPDNGDTHYGFFEVTWGF
ncbi:alginate export family protein [Sphingomonas sp. DT-207]|uniref:alginate export family protein n=1 Tax=Sphingomonas sp. DT-207 TaxID=3396167 RepID=UPI003F1B5149